MHLHNSTYYKNIMKLITEEIKKILPKLHEQESKELDAVAYLKFFTPDSNWTWYVTEFDGKDICFGLVDGFERELGYFSLKELEGIRGPFGLKIERDLYFKQTTIRELINGDNK